MSTTRWHDRTPSGTETEQRAADDREALRDRIKDITAGVIVLLLVVGLVAAVVALGGELS